MLIKEHCCRSPDLGLDLCTDVAGGLGSLKLFVLFLVAHGALASPGSGGGGNHYPPPTTSPMDDAFTALSLLTFLLLSSLPFLRVKLLLTF